MTIASELTYPSLYKVFTFVNDTLKICSLNVLQKYNVLLLTTVICMYSSSLEVTPPLKLKFCIVRPASL
jgi:hypothetical protein